MEARRKWKRYKVGTFCSERARSGINLGDVVAFRPRRSSIANAIHACWRCTERKNGEWVRGRKRRIVLLEIVTDRKSRFLTQHHISASTVRIGMQNFFLAEKCDLRFSTLRPCRTGFGRRIHESCILSISARSAHIVKIGRFEKMTNVFIILISLNLIQSMLVIV